jgi:hypothetical protein
MSPAKTITQRQCLRLKQTFFDVGTSFGRPWQNSCMLTFCKMALLAAGALFLFAPLARAQAPALLWATNVGARVFSIDNQTNVYAGVSGSVVKISPVGDLLQTISLTNRPGMPQRDSAGNLYYAGIYPGYYNLSGYEYSNPACFFMTYNSSGQAIRSVDFGPTGFIRNISITDLQFDTAGNCYVAYTFNVSTTDHTDGAAKFDTTGSNVWSIYLPKYPYSSTTIGAAHFGPLSATNGYVMTLANTAYGTYSTLSSIDSAGATTQISYSMGGPDWNTDRPAGVPDGNFYNFEGTFLTKRSSDSSVIWSEDLGTRTKATIREDRLGGIILMDNNGAIQRFDSAGGLAWTTNYGSLLNAIVIDAGGNRFVSLADGRVARLANEIVSGPTITNSPQAMTVLAGTSPSLSVGASGSGPLLYQWLRNSNSIPDATNAILNFPNITTAQAGYYSVIVSNFLGLVISTPAQLRVKSVAIYSNNQLLTNGTYVFASAPTMSIHSSFTNGSFFYTLDGSTPSFNSALYSGPFTLNNSATVRAIGYSADFLQSEEADTVSALVLVNHTLVATTPGGGAVSLNPPGGTYASTNMVSATANPSSGWSFLYWLGDASGTNPTVNISMTQDRAISAVFGTTLSTTVAGNGQVLPAGGVYPYGSVVRLTGVPGPYSYFGSWGNSASGNNNPLYFTISSPNPTVSSIFGITPSDQAALTVEIVGNGKVTVNPRANVYPTNQTVSLTAVPDSGSSFVDWSGDASGTQNPLNVSMTQSKVIVANFSGGAMLRANQNGVEGLRPEGFRMTLISDPNSIWKIFGATNLGTWDLLGTVTNSLGEIQFTDPAALNLSRRFYRAQLGP